MRGAKQREMLEILRKKEILHLIFWDHHKIGIFLEVITMNFRVFSEGQVTDCRIFFGLLKF